MRWLIDEMLPEISRWTTTSSKRSIVGVSVSMNFGWNPTLELMDQLNGRLAFTESDEISVRLPRGWDMFDRKVEKVVSVSAGIASAAFTRAAGEPVHFDSRAARRIGRGRRRVLLMAPVHRTTVLELHKRKPRGCREWIGPPRPPITRTGQLRTGETHARQAIERQDVLTFKPARRLRFRESLPLAEHRLYGRGCGNRRSADLVR